MKIVVNKRFGGFGVKDIVEDALGAPSWELERTDPRLIAMIEENGAESIQDSFAKLKIVEIPDDATDWEMNDYDGIETITYVVGGKIYHV